MYKTAKVFVDEAGPIKINDGYLLVIGSVITNDNLIWVKDKYHFRKDSKERKKDFLMIIRQNLDKFSAIINVYSYKRADAYRENIFKIYVEDVIKSISNITRDYAEIFYDSLEDKLPKELKNETNFHLKLLSFLKKQNYNISIKIYPSIGKSGKKGELHAKGVCVADYIASASLQLIRGTIDREIESIFQDIFNKISKNLTSLP